MAVGDNNIQVSDIKLLLGVSYDEIPDLCDNDQINIYSFYSPIDLRDSYTTNEIERAPKTGNWYFDFRRYNHAAGIPQLVGTTPNAYSINGGAVKFDILVRHEEVNLLAVNSDLTKIKVKLFSNSTYTNYIGERLEDVAFNTVTPPPDAYKNQTQKPDYQQVITEIVVPNGLSYNYVWFEVWLCDSNGNEVVHYPTWRGAAQVVAVPPPRIQYAVEFSTWPAQYSMVYFVASIENLSGANINFHGHLLGYPLDGGPIEQFGGQADFKYLNGGTLYDLQLNRPMYADVETPVTGTLNWTPQNGDVVDIKVYIDFAT